MLNEAPENQARRRRRRRGSNRRTTNAPMNNETSSSRLKLKRVAGASASGRGHGYTMLRHQLALIVMGFVTLSGTICRPGLAVSVQRLNVPDLVVVDQFNQRQQQQQQLNQRIGGDLGHGRLAQSSARPGGLMQPTQQPEAASLTKSQDLSNSMNNEQQQQQQLTFECLISYDRKRDKNLIVKWHHDDPLEPIYQWIVGLDKISIAPKYQPYILAINSTAAARQQQLPSSVGDGGGGGGPNWTGGPANATAGNSNQIQLLEASFKLVRPSKELGGKYTCSAISSLNDDSKWKKMIVFNPPRSFSIEAFRTDAGTQSAAAAQRERIRKLTQQQQQQPLSADETPAATTSPIGDSSQLPLAYRRRIGQSGGGGGGFDGIEQQTSTTAAAGKTIQVIDYVNVSENRRQKGASRGRINQPPPPPVDAADQSAPPNGSGQSLNMAAAAKRANGGAGDGVKLVCDIDQVFPVPEVNIYRLANLDGSHPDKLAKLETKIEKNPLNGLYHVQVASVLSDDEIEVKYGSSGADPVYFECLIALTNLELSKYADNKRTIVYHRPGSLAGSAPGGVQGMQTASSATSLGGELGHRINSDQSGSSSSSSSSSLSCFNSIYNKSLMLALIMMNSSLFALILERHFRGPILAPLLIP